MYPDSLTKSLDSEERNRSSGSSLSKQYLSSYKALQRHRKSVKLSNTSSNPIRIRVGADTDQHNGGGGGERRFQHQARECDHSNINRRLAFTAQELRQMCYPLPPPLRTDQAANMSQYSSEQVTSHPFPSAVPPTSATSSPTSLLVSSTSTSPPIRPVMRSSRGSSECFV